jgi:two-component system OmpR family response regulator
MSRKKHTILCVDDNQVAVSGWSLYLQQHGYSVVSAFAAEEGLQLFATQAISAVILDYAMPELDGTAVSALMKRMKPEVPIILFTGVSELPTEVLAKVDGFMVKGKPPSDMLQIIDRLLGVEESAEGA